MTDDLDLIARLSAAALELRQNFRREMADRGFPWHLTACGEVLPHLEPGGLSQTALTERMGLSKQAVQQLLDQLETAGVVRRDPDPADKRARRVSLTELGLRDRAERRAVLQLIEERTRDTVGKKLFGKLEKALRRLNTSA